MSLSQRLSLHWLVCLGLTVIIGLILVNIYRGTFLCNDIRDTSNIGVPSTQPFLQLQSSAQPLHQLQPSAQPAQPSTAQPQLQPFLDVICVFPLMESKEISGSRYSHVQRPDLLKREKEYVYSLRLNVRHPLVASVHLFSHRPHELYDKLRKEYGIDMTKVFVHSSSENPTYRNLFEFVSGFFQRRVVMIMNADNYIGDGFEKLDLDYMRLTKVMYALTRRYPVPMPPGCSYPIASYCEKKSWYQDSHDAFLFFVHSPLPETFLKEVDFASNQYGSENVVIWAFKSILKFAVLNPCKLLRIHHFHCSQIRPKVRPWVDKPETHGQANFTNSLYVIP